MASPLYQKITFFGDDDIAILGAVSTDPTDDGTPRENILWSSTDPSATAWTKAGVTFLDAPSYFGDQYLAKKITQSAAGGSIGQIRGTYSVGDLPFAWAIIENVDATITDIGIYDNTAAVWRHRVRLTWATMAISVLTTSGGGNAGVVPLGSGKFLLWVSATPGASGNQRRFLLYPLSSSGVNGQSIIVHHIQFEPKSLKPHYAIVTPNTGGVVDPAIQPYLVPIDQTGDASVNFVQGAASIGQIRFKVLDKRTDPADQDTGWFTNLLRNSQGYNQLIGRRIIAQQQVVSYGPYQKFFDGVMEDTPKQTGQDMVFYDVSCRDIQERPRKTQLFTKLSGRTILPWGIEAGYGKVEGFIGRPGMTQYLIPPPDPVHGVVKKDGPFAAMPTARWVKFDFTDVNRKWEQYGIDNRSDGRLGKVIMPYTEYVDGDGGKKVRWAQVKWRAEGLGGAYTTLTDMPFESGSGGTTGFCAARWIQGFAGIILSGSNLPAVGARIELLVVPNPNPTPSTLPQAQTHFQQLGRPTEDVPLYLEMSFGQLVKNCYDGVYSDYGSASAPIVPYDAAAMATFIATTPVARVKITEPVDDMKAWLQEQAYKVLGAAAILDVVQGKVVPTKYSLPDPSVPLLQLGDNDVHEDAAWTQGKTGAINNVTFTYIREFIRPNEVGENLLPIDRLIQKEVTIEDLSVDSYALLGDQPLVYKPVTVRSIVRNTNGAPDGLVDSEEGWQIAQNRIKDVKTRFKYGDQRVACKARRSVPGVQKAKVGDWVQVSISWLPDLATGKLGLNRLMQIVKIGDKDAIWRGFELSDSGPFDVPTAVPTVSAPTSSGVTVSAAVTAIGAGVIARMDYAIGTVEPTTTSPDWKFFGTTDTTSTVSDGPFSYGQKVWIRVRGESPGKRPSAWITIGSVVIGDTARVVDTQIYRTDTGVPIVYWATNGAVLGVRINYKIFVGDWDGTWDGFVDANAADASKQLAIAFPSQTKLAVRIDPYPGWTGSAVSGVVGELGLVVVVENFGNYYNPVTGQETLTIPTIQSLAFDNAGNLVVGVNGDLKTKSLKGFAQVGTTDPTIAQIRTGTNINGRTVEFVFGPFTNNQEVHVGVLAYSEVGSTGSESLPAYGNGVYISPVATQPLKPELDITQSIITPPTISTETVTISASLGNGAIGPLTWRKREFNSKTVSPPAWGAFQPNSGATALPFEYTMTRELKWPKTLEVQASDGTRITTHKYFIASKLETLNDSGVLDDSFPMTSGGRPFRRTIDDTTQVINTSSRSFIDGAGLDLSLRPTSIYRGSAYEAATNLFKRGTDTAIDIVPTAARTFIAPAMVDASLRVTSVFRTATTEPVTNLFKRGSDTAVDIVESSGRWFTDNAALDASRRPINVYRGVAYEPVSNLFKRNADSAADVVTTSTRTFVDPNAATQVDASGRIVGVYRLGVYEPVNNLVKFGDTISAAGSIADTALSSNIPRKNAANTFTGSGPQSFTSGGTWTTSGWNRAAQMISATMLEFGDSGVARMYGLGNSAGILYGMTTTAETSGALAGYWMTVNNQAVNFPSTVSVGAYAGGAIVAGSVVSRRSSTEGAILFGDALTHYLYTDYTKYYFGTFDRLNAGGYEFNNGNANGSYIDGQVANFGSFRAVGNYAGYAGIEFSSATINFMVYNDGVYWGFWNSTLSGWKWLFDDAQSSGGVSMIGTYQQFLGTKSLSGYTSGGLIFYNSAVIPKGRIHWDATGFGLLDESSNWFLRRNLGVALTQIFGDMEFFDGSTGHWKIASVIVNSGVWSQGSGPTPRDGTIILEY